MPTPVTMPVLGLTMEEGTIAEWLKQEGQPVRKDEPLLMVEMDKGTVEVPSPASGVLTRILVSPGGTVPVKTLIAEIGGVSDADRSSAIASAQLDFSVAGSPQGVERVFASPRARRRAREARVDLGSIVGSGPNGRIVEADVACTRIEDRRVLATSMARRAADEHGLSLAAVQGSGPGGRITRDDVLRTALAQADSRQHAPDNVLLRAAQQSANSNQEDDNAPRIAPLSRIRRVTAERMSASAAATARVTLFLDTDFSEVSHFRLQLRPELQRLGVPDLPWEAILARALGLAITEHPRIQAQWTDTGLVESDGVHIGVAVALEAEGLVVPVLRSADRRSLRGLAENLLQLIGSARAHRLAPSDLAGGTFTITNLGAYGIETFTPLINPPETAILGVGRIADKAVVVDGAIEVRRMCTLSLSFDHRVIDGAPAAAFLARLAELLERPYALLGI